MQRLRLCSAAVGLDGLLLCLCVPTLLCAGTNRLFDRAADDFAHMSVVGCRRPSPPTVEVVQGQEVTIYNIREININVTINSEGWEQD